ncbi:MAG: radical SAM protein [Deltaproteobacteria bacterium]|nr:radical SAM protein [Deltaproteobacteria bacterium]
MRTALLFPPQASPTYVPLGISLLAAYVRQQLGPGHVSCFDLNVAAWEQLAALASGGERLLRFLRGQEGSFYDEGEYRRVLGDFTALQRGMAELARDARRYVEAGELSGLLGRLLDEQLRGVLAARPDRVGISILFPQQLVFGLALARRLSAEIDGPWGLPPSAPAGTTAAAAAAQQQPEGGAGGGQLRLLLGGAALSSIDTAELLAACPYLDGVVRGEGEPALLALCREPYPRTVPGLLQRNPHGAPLLVRHPAGPPLALDDLPPADFSGLELTRYLSPAPVLPVVSSRGCRWRRCRFCAHNHSFGAYRAKSAQRFVDELEQQCRQHGVRHFYFADQYVAASDLGRIAAALLRRRLRIHFHVMGRPTHDYEEALLADLARAGCRWISWGVETGSQRLLDIAGKGTCVAEIRRVLERTAAAGISSLPMMLFGLPTSTDVDLEQTFELLESCYDRLEAMTASSFVLYRGTPFGSRPEHYGMEVVGRELLLSPQGRPVHSTRLHYKERAADGSLRPPRGALEVARWEQRRRWLGESSLLEEIWAEHYLLHVAHRHEQGRDPAAGLDPPQPARDLVAS